MADVALEEEPTSLTIDDQTTREMLIADLLGPLLPGGWLIIVNHERNVIELVSDDVDTNALYAELVKASEGIDIPGGIPDSIELQPGGGFNAQVNGGGSLHFGTTSAHECSSAFPVKRVGGPELGILTAGHCPAVGYRYGYGSPTTLAFGVIPGSQITDRGANGGDFRWLHSPVMLSGKTWANWGSERKFSSTDQAEFGDYVCRFGWTTGYGCGYVGAINALGLVEPGDTIGYEVEVGPLACVIGSQMTVGTHTEGGDSGAPWSLSTTAYGIHTGGNEANTYSCFSNVRHALSRLGLQLWTG